MKFSKFWGAFAAITLLAASAFFVSCSSDSDSSSDPTLPAHEHTWNDGEVTTKPTAMSDGVKTFTCTVCGYAKTESIEKVPEGFAFVEGGTIVGSADNATFGYEGVFIENRTVKLSNFYMGKTEITKKLYKEIMSDTTLNTLGLTADPSYSTSNPTTYVIQSGEVDELRPVENVSWYDAVYFCNLLSKRDGLEEVYTITNPTVSSGTISNATVTADHTKNGYRLPTEAEWEYAARGGKNSSTWNYEYAGADSTATRVPGSDSALDSVGWYCLNICNNGVTTITSSSSGTAGYGTHEVAKKQKNGLDLYDMSGNVGEWCYDWYGSVETGTVENPMGVSTGSFRVRRGGSWGNYAFPTSVGYRDSYNIYPDYRYYYLGFRVCRSAQ